MTHGLKAFAIAVSGVMLSGGSALAQDYPTGDIDWVVMWSSGGGADTATRTFVNYFEEELGGNVVVRNVTGGGGSIGYMEALGGDADGYTLVTVQGDLPKYQPMGMAPIHVNDFDFIGGFAVQSPILITREDSPWDSLQDFVEDAKNNPGEYTIGVSDIGGVHHQPVVLWAEEAGIDISAISHEGSPQMNAALLGGHVDLISSYIRPAAPYVEDGELKFLGHFGRTSPADYPDVQTVQDLGYDVVWEQPYGLGAPAGLPDDIRSKLEEATRAVWNNPEFEEELANLGLEVYDVDGSQLKETFENMQSDIARVLEVLEDQE